MQENQVWGQRQVQYSDAGELIWVLGRTEAARGRDNALRQAQDERFCLVPRLKGIAAAPLEPLSDDRRERDKNGTDEKETGDLGRSADR